MSILEAKDLASVNLHDDELETVHLFKQRADKARGLEGPPTVIARADAVIE